MAAAALHRIGRGAEIERRFADRAAAPAVASMLARGLRSPPTSSMGRWFDAAAALLGVRETSAYEGQAPMLLEARAGGRPDTHDDEADDLVRLLPDGNLDPGALVARLADEADARRGAMLFHRAIAAGLDRWVAAAAASTGLRTVALAGGCFLNRLLSALVVERLEARGLVVLQAQQAPPNDGGIALGQAWAAICARTAGG
jgi:hydrogenase maturation protein HypF